MGVTVEGLDVIRADVAESSAAMADSRPVLTAWAAQLEALIDRSFATSATPEGAAWAPRKLTTRNRTGGRERPRARTPGRSLGVETGAMRASVEATVSGNAIALAIDARHARFFVGGTRYQPARGLLPTHETGQSATALDELAESLADHAVEPLRG